MPEEGNPGQSPFPNCIAFLPEGLVLQQLVQYALDMEVLYMPEMWKQRLQVRQLFKFPFQNFLAN